MEKQGIIKVFARTGGVMFDDEDGVWYNPEEDLKERIKDDWKKYKGKEVLLTLLKDNPKTFSKIEIITNNASNNQPSSVGGPVRVDVLDKDRLIVRQTCVKAAAEIFASKPEKFAGKTDLVGLARELERYVYGPVGEQKLTVTTEDVNSCSSVHQG